MLHFEHMSDRDLNLRYGDSIVKANKRPFKVLEVTRAREGIKFNGIYMHSNRTTSVMGSNIDSSPIPLGFVNGFNFPVKLIRSPSRHYKQGINSKNTRILMHDTQGATSRKGSRLETSSDSPMYRGLYDLINGNYPSYNEALASLDDIDKLPSCAFNRSFCLFKNNTSISIHNNKWVIGTIDDNGDPQLFDNFIYFQEQLRSCMA